MYDQLSHHFEYISEADGDGIPDGREIYGYTVKRTPRWLIGELMTKLVNQKETHFSKIWDFILNYLGITVSYGATIIGIIETTVESIGKKSFSWFFAGLTLAVSGFFLDAATSAFSLSGTVLQIADIVGTGISAVGLCAMIISAFSPDKRDPTEEAIAKVSPLPSILEWIVAIGGFAKAIIDYMGDQSAG